MNNIEFVDKLKKIEQSPTHYAKGMFGQGKSALLQKQKQYPSWYTDSRMKELNACDNATKFFDCCGLVKYILWIDNNGKCVYSSNGVSDMDETTLFNKCTNKSTDFKNVEDGEIVWTTGHIGVVVDSSKGLVIECTNAWTKEVLISSYIKGNSKNYRVWKKHGKLPYIEYTSPVKFKVMTDHDFVEVHNSYTSTKHYGRAQFLNIVETKDNFGKTDSGEWIDLTKCKKVVM